MSENRNFLGVWIPKELWLNKELTLQEKCLFIEIQSLDNEHGCYANNQYFADFFSVTKGRISQILRSLASKGYIAIELLPNKGNKRTIRTLVTYRLRVAIEGCLENDNTPLGNDNTSNQKLNHNNTVSNAKSNTKEKEPSQKKDTSYTPSKEEVELKFRPAYDAYPGSKGEYWHDYHCFMKGCKDSELSLAEELSLLLPAIKRQITYRQDAKGFVPEWRDFAGWLNTAYWHWKPPQEPESDVGCSLETQRIIYDMYKERGELVPPDVSFEVWAKIEAPPA